MSEEKGAIITADEFELMERHGFSILSGGWFWDEQTSEAYQPLKALAMARCREQKMKKDKSDQSITIGIRSGTLAYDLALETFSQGQWQHAENDPKKTAFPLQVYKVSKEDYKAFEQLYMECSGREKAIDLDFRSNNEHDQLEEWLESWSGLGNTYGNSNNLD